MLTEQIQATAEGLWLIFSHILTFNLIQYYLRAASCFCSLETHTLYVYVVCLCILALSLLCAGRNIRALIRPFPKWTPNKPIDEMPRAEIILYEQADTPFEEEDNMQLVVR